MDKELRIEKDKILLGNFQRYNFDAFHLALAKELQDARAAIAELEAQLQALGVVVDGQNRKLKIMAAAAAARGDGFGPVPAQPTDGMSYMERARLLDTDINEV